MPNNLLMKNREKQLKQEIVVMVSHLDTSQRIHQKGSIPLSCIKGSNWTRLRVREKKAKSTNQGEFNNSKALANINVIERQRRSEKNWIDSRKRHKTQASKQVSIVCDQFAPVKFTTQTAAQQNQTPPEQCFNPDILKSYMSQLDLSAKFNRFTNILKQKYCQFSKLRDQEETMEAVGITEDMKKCMHLISSPKAREKSLRSDEIPTRTTIHKQNTRYEQRKTNMHRRVASAAPRTRQVKRKMTEAEHKPFNNIDSFQVKKIEVLEFNDLKGQIKLPNECENSKKKCCSSLKDSLRASRMSTSVLKQKPKGKLKFRSRMFDHQSLEMRGWEIERTQQLLKDEEHWEIFE